MTLQSKSFTINKSATLEQIAQFLESEIGLNAFLIKGIRGVALSTDVTQLTILYEKYASYILDSIAPREGALFTDDVASNDFDIRFLFNEPVNANSITNGTFSIDGQPLTADEVYVDPTTNNYFLKIHASGTAFQTNDFHTYQISDTLKREDGSSYNYTPVGGYIFHGISSPHLGDYSEDYIGRRRGKLAVGVVKLSKNINPQQGILEFLSQRQLSNNNLITYTPVSSSTNTVTVYFIYIKNLEPQIVSGFPLDNSLLPDVSAPTKVTFVFNTKLDSSKLASVTGLFSVEEGFATSTDVDPSDITLLSDRQTVEINTTNYFNGRKVYSILAKPGIRSLEGLDKEKPEQWTIHIAPYEASGVGGSGVSQADFDDLVADFQSHSGLSSIHYETGEISISTGQIPDLPPIIDEARFVALSGAFTGFTGDEFASLSTSVSTNTNNLAIVSGTVVSNTTSISTNASNLAVVSGLVDTNTSDLGYVSGLVNTNTTNISTNANNLAVVSGNVVSNTSNISTNAFNLAVVSGLVDTNTTNINSLSDNFTGHTGVTSIHFTEGSIDHQNIIGAGSNTHAQIDTHISSTSNPHNVTAAQVDAPTTTEFDSLSGHLTGLIGNNTNSIGAVTAYALATRAILTGHTGDSTIHFTKNSISVGDLSDTSIADTPTSGDILRYDGADWVAYSTGAGESVDGNLSNLTDVNESRKNLKVRYQIDDIVDYSFLAGGRNVGGGGTYLFNLDAYTFMEQDPLNYGVMTATNSSATANGGASRYSNRVGYLVDDLEYYYRVAISHTTSIKARFGMAYDISTDEHVTGFCPHSVYFEFDSSTDTNWHACATNGTTTTRVDTSFAPTAQSWEWMGFMPVSSGVYFFRYTDATTSEAQALAFIGSSLMPQAGSKGQRVFITTISNGATFRHMLLDKFAYPLNANYLPSGLAIRTFE